MVGIFCNRTACRIRNRRRRHDSNMNLRKKRTPRASQHYVGWRARQKSLLLPVAGEVFLLTLPFIEQPLPEKVLVPISDLATKPASWITSVLRVTEVPKPLQGKFVVKLEKTRGLKVV